MSRKKYKSRDKKVHKMTKDGLVERNATTGELENISKREQDLLLRKQPDTKDEGIVNIQKQSRQNTRRKKRKSARYRTSEQPATTQATNTADVSPPSIVESEIVNLNRDIPEKGEKIASTQPIERSYETKISLPKKESTNVFQNPINEVAPPPKFGSAEHSNRLRFSDNVKPETPLTIKSEQLLNFENTNKLQFTKDNKLTTARTGAKPRQSGEKPPSGNKYQQHFTPEAAKPSTQNISEEAKAENTNIPNNLQPENEVVGNSERPYTTKVPQTDQPPNTVRKLYFNKNNRLSQRAARTKPRQNVGNPVSDIKNISESVPDKPKEKVKLEKSQVQNTDSRSTTLREKPDKLKFTAIRSTDNKPKRQKYKQRIEIKPTQKPVEPMKKPDKPGTLQFTRNEKTPIALSDDKKLTQLQDKSDKSHAKLEKARNKLPSTKRLKEVRTFDEKKGKAKTKLQFEKEILPPGSQKPITPAPVALAKKGTDGITRVGANKLHQKVYEVEHENVGTQAAHRVEQAAESVYRGGKRVTRSAFRYVRNRPYRAVEKLEKKAIQADMRLSYRKALNENPQLKSNFLPRYMQKRKIKQQYAQAAREAKRTGETVKKTGDITVRAAKAVGGAIKRHPVAAAVVLLILLLIFFIASLFSAFGGMAGSGVPAFIASTYLAQDDDINQAELSYTEWETDLQMQIQNAESDYPGYNEYRYNIDSISHNPYELLAFLTAVYGEFQYADIEVVLQQIFNEQYQLAFTPSIEIRYYENEDGELIQYDWNVLTVTLTSRSFTDVIFPYLTDQTGLYGLLKMSGGNRQYVGSPFDFNWLANVTSHFGYRIHPITGVKDFHKGIDIAVPVGTEIHSAQDGTVTFAGWNDSYGYYVVVEDDNGLVTKYAHCDSLLVSAGQEVKVGDIIAKSGNTGDSTGAHLHFEVIKDGQYLNALIFAMHS